MSAVWKMFPAGGIRESARVSGPLEAEAVPVHDVLEEVQLTVKAKDTLVSSLRREGIQVCAV